MIIVYTYKIKKDGQEDYCQFFEYTPRQGMKVIDSHDIPIALLFPRHLIPRQYLRNLIKHYFGECHVTYVNSVEHKADYLDMG